MPDSPTTTLPAVETAPESDEHFRRWHTLADRDRPPTEHDQDHEAEHVVICHVHEAAE